MNVVIKKIDTFLAPQKVIYKNCIYKITQLNSKYFIKGYKVLLVNDMIEGVTLDNLHPNADPTDGDFCMPEVLLGIELNQKSINSINSMLCCFNIDDCYFTPWGEITIEKI